MEQTQVESKPLLSYQHNNGEIFVADDIDMARGMCPVLGRMSVEEAGLLIELEAMGKEKLADKQSKPEEEATVIAESLFGEKTKLKQKPDQYNKVFAEITIADPKAMKSVKPETRTDFLEEITSSNVKTERSPDIALSMELQAQFIRQVEASRLLDAVEEAASLQPASERSLEVEDVRVAATTEKPILLDVKIKRISRADEKLGISIQESPYLDAKEAKPIEDISPRLGMKSSTLGQELPLVKLETKNTEAKDIPAKQKILTTRIGETPYASHGLADVTDGTTALIDVNGDTAPDNLMEEEGIILLLAQIESDMVDFDQNSDAIPPFESPVVTVEVVIGKLVETVESEPDKAQVLHDALEEITQLSFNQVIGTTEDTQIIELELEKIFVKLFNQLAINYTPKLIDSFVQLTRDSYLEELLTNMVAKEELKELPNVIGTHEFLQKLQKGLVSLKRAIDHSYVIGKSVLCLCVFNYAPLGMVV